MYVPEDLLPADYVRRFRDKTSENYMIVTEYGYLGEVINSGINLYIEARNAFAREAATMQQPIPENEIMLDRGENLLTLSTTEESFTAKVETKGDTEYSKYTVVNKDVIGRAWVDVWKKDEIGRAVRKYSVTVVRSLVDSRGLDNKWTQSEVDGLQERAMQDPTLGHFHIMVKDYSRERGNRYIYGMEKVQALEEIRTSLV